MAGNRSCADTVLRGGANESWLTEEIVTHLDEGKIDRLRGRAPGMARRPVRRSAQRKCGDPTPPQHSPAHRREAITGLADLTGPTGDHWRPHPPTSTHQRSTAPNRHRPAPSWPCPALVSPTPSSDPHPVRCITFLLDIRRSIRPASRWNLPKTTELPVLPSDFPNSPCAQVN